MNRKNIIIGILCLIVSTVMIKPNLINRVYYKIGFTKTPANPHVYYIQEMWKGYVKKSLGINNNTSMIFFGDSILKSLCVESLFGGINFSVSGEELAGAKEKIPSIHNLENKTLVFAYGINDLGSGKSPEEIRGYYEDLFQELEGKNLTIFISSILPTLDKEKNTKIVKTNELIYDLTVEYENISYIDGGKYLKEASGIYLDLVHLNNKGNSLWVKALNEKLINNKEDSLLAEAF